MQEFTWPQPKQDVDISAFNTYEFSPNITYRFCDTCSALVFYESEQHPEKLGAFTGCVRHIENFWVATDHIYVEDTIDGGASVWLRKPNPDGKEIPRTLTRSGDISWEWPGKIAIERLKKAEEAKSIPVWCKCKGIDLVLHRGDYAQRAREDLPHFVDPRNNKLNAIFDPCDSCRLHFGNDMVNWCFAEMVNISRADGVAFPKTSNDLRAAVDAGDPSVDTLGYYKSSPEVQRYFCKVCSASAFYAHDSHPSYVDIAVGLLEAADGARAESFLSWNYGDDIEFAEDADGGWREELLKNIQRDAEEYRVASNYPKNWLRDEKEAKG